jgi:hypothetical protein
MSLKQRWIDALRSGKYAQGTHNLRTVDDKFCCLGVLCDVIDKNNWERSSNLGYMWNGNTCLLPSSVSVKFETLDIEELMHMNDSLRYSFADIAAYIETDVEEKTNG